MHELQDEALPLLLGIEHQQVNTLLELTKLYPYVLLNFIEENEILKFKGATFNLNEFEKTFYSQYQYKRFFSFIILFLLSWKMFHISLMINDNSHTECIEILLCKIKYNIFIGNECPTLFIIRNLKQMPM